MVDTLRLSDTLQKTGMEREQAEGFARALDKEFGEHVAMRSDLDAGFQAVRSEMALMRSELERRIESLRSDLKALNAKFNFGFGLLVAFLSVLVGIGLLNLNKPSMAPLAAPQVSVSGPATLAPVPPTAP